MKVQIRVEYWGRNRFVVRVLKDGVTLEQQQPATHATVEARRNRGASAGVSWTTRSRRPSRRPGTCAAEKRATWELTRKCVRALRAMRSGSRGSCPKT